jgi:hypothetical protein
MSTGFAVSVVADQDRVERFALLWRTGGLLRWIKVWEEQERVIWLGRVLWDTA